MTVYPRAAVSDFARQVRANLRGLSPEEIDDLTEGMEADLAAALADAVSGANSEIPDPLDVFGSPASYAAELQAAAGLDAPIRPRRGIRAWLRRCSQRCQSMVTTTREALAGTRFGRVLLEQRRAARPAWWIARGWLVYALVEAVVPGPMQLIPTDLGKWLGLIVLVVASYAWGMTAPRWPSLLRRFAIVVSVGLVVVGFPAMLGAAALSNQAAWAAPVVQDGVYVGGEPAQNIYPYDAEGEPLTGVQLFDQDGRPIRVGSDSDGQWTSDGTQHWRLLPATSQSGAKLWNVFPLQGIADGGHGHASGEPSKVPADSSPLVGPLAPNSLDPDSGTTPQPTSPDSTSPAEKTPEPTPSPSAAASAKPKASSTPSSTGAPAAASSSTAP